MEFSRSRRLAGKGRRYAGWGLVAEAGAIGWAVAAHGETRGTAFLAVGLAALAMWVRVGDLRTARQPFRPRIDEFGVTLLEGRLGWARIDGIGLRYGARSKSVERGDGRAADLPDPDLLVCPAEGAELPGRRTSLVNGRAAYHLIGPEGVTMRDFAAPKLVFGWHQVSAITVGRRPARRAGTAACCCGRPPASTSPCPAPT